MEHFNSKDTIFPKFDKILKVSLEICDNLLEFNNQQNIEKDIVQKASDITIDEDNNLENIFPKFDKILKVSLEICDNLVKLNNQQKIKKDIVQNDSNIVIDEDNALRFIKQEKNNITTNLIPQIEQHNISTNNEQGFILSNENIFPKFDKILKVSLEICDNLVKLNNQQKIKKDIVQND